MKTYEIYEIQTYKALTKITDTFFNNTEKLTFNQKSSFHQDNNSYNKYKKLNTMGYRFKSYIRGDSIIKKTKLNIVDNKDYSFIYDKLKPSKNIDKSSFIKTVDSNLKAFFNNNIFKFRKNNSLLKKMMKNKKLKNCQFSLGSITGSEFNFLKNFFEFGLCTLSEDSLGNKFIVSKEINSHSLYRIKDIRAKNITVKFHTEEYQSEKKKSIYGYIGFYNNGKLIYEVSCRENGSANSTFISVSLLETFNFKTIVQIAKKIKELSK